jgi:hypothetical protein
MILFFWEVAERFWIDKTSRVFSAELGCLVR